jgi:hypothetical protein
MRFESQENVYFMDGSKLWLIYEYTSNSNGVKKRLKVEGADLVGALKLG